VKESTIGKKQNVSEVLKNVHGGGGGPIGPGVGRGAGGPGGPGGI
jgi:hypothetical protein